MSKRMIALIAALLFVNQSFAQSSEKISRLEVFSDNQLMSFESTKNLNVKFWLQQLVLSALYRNEVQDSSLNEWQVQLSTSTRVHCHYSFVASLGMPERETLRFEEVLLPLSSDGYPEYIFIRQGRSIQRLAKYDPWVLRKLVSEAELPLYKDLPEVERGLF